MASAELTSAVAALLQSQGIDAGGISLATIDGGGNNKVYAVDTRSGKYVAKAYFTHPADTRDRLGAEYAFLSYAKRIGLINVPNPIACSFEKHIGIYAFIEGHKLDRDQLEEKHVSAAAEFIASLNAGSDRDPGLPAASEACFSIEQHLATVDRRLSRLQLLEGEDALTQRARCLIAGIADAWRRHRALIDAADIPALLDEDRCISPSDFGFHNALLRDSGDLCFIDFEYAGWDDPAKMIGDFFCQPAVPVAQAYFDDFVAEAVRYSRNASALQARAHLLLPALQIKWCCIMLNEFLPDAAQRRQFANPTSQPEQRKQVQLDKTEHFFNSRLT
jgi:thiamine kinase-like enzyme